MSSRLVHTAIIDALYVATCLNHPERRRSWRLLRALELFRATESRTGLAITLNNLGNTLMQLGRPEEALTPLTEALTLSQHIGNRVSEAGVLNHLASVHRDSGHLSPAQELAETALGIARELNHRVLEAAILSTLGTIHQRTGRPAKALAAHRDAYELANQAGHTQLMAEIHVDLAAAYRSLDQHDLATSHASRALTIARANDYQKLARQAAAALAPAAPPLPAASERSPDSRTRHKDQYRV